MIQAIKCARGPKSDYQHNVDSFFLTKDGIEIKLNKEEYKQLHRFITSTVPAHLLIRDLDNGETEMFDVMNM